MAQFTLPPLGDQTEIVTQSRRPSLAFSRYWNSVITRLVSEINTQSEILARLTANEINVAAVASQAQSAAATANSAATGVSAGVIIRAPWSSVTMARTVVATVPLTGVVAGTLRFDTTRLYPEGTSSMVGEFTSGTWWISEQLTSGGAKTDLLTGFWTADGGGEFILSLAINDEAALDAARPTAVNVGAVTYRLEVQRTSGGAINSAFADLRVAQA